MSRQLPVEVTAPLHYTDCMSTLLQLLSAGLIQLERMKGGRYFGGLFTYWLMLIVFGAIVLYSKIRRATEEVSVVCLLSCCIHRCPSVRLYVVSYHRTASRTCSDLRRSSSTTLWSGYRWSCLSYLTLASRRLRSVEQLRLSLNVSWSISCERFQFCCEVRWLLAVCFQALSPVSEILHSIQYLPVT